MKSPRDFRLSIPYDLLIVHPIYVNYIWGSEEYNEWVDSLYNDKFFLFLDGSTNIATLPGGTAVEIDSVNNGDNPAYYRDNTVLGLDLQYDGLTTVLTASATGLSAGVHSFEFRVEDLGDDIYDSGVFVSGGTFSTEPSSVPAPGTLALLVLGLAGMGFRQ